MKPKSNLYVVRLSVIGIAVLCSSCGNPERDFRKAEEANSESGFKEFIKKHADNPLAIQASNRIEELAFEQAKKAASVPGYQRFLMRYPASRFAAQAQANIENIEFTDALQSPAIPTLESLLKRYPTSTNQPEAKAKLAELLLPGVIQSNTVACYEDFRQRFGGTESAKTALLKVAKLDYDHAVTANDIASYESFLRKYPDSQFTESVKSRIEPQLEERDWNQALLKNTISAYLRYYESHTNSTRVQIYAGPLTAEPKREDIGAGFPVYTTSNGVIIRINGIEVTIDEETAKSLGLLKYEQQAEMRNGKMYITVNTKLPTVRAKVMAVRDGNKYRVIQAARLESELPSP